MCRRPDPPNQVHCTHLIDDMTWPTQWLRYSVTFLYAASNKNKNRIEKKRKDECNNKSSETHQPTVNENEVQVWFILYLFYKLRIENWEWRCSFKFVQSARAYIPHPYIIPSSCATNNSNNGSTSVRCFCQMLSCETTRPLVHSAISSRLCVCVTSFCFFLKNILLSFFIFFLLL